MLKGLYLIMPGYDSREKQHKKGIKLMCPLVEKLLKLKKVCSSWPKSAQKNCPVMPMKVKSQTCYCKKGSDWLKRWAEVQHNI